METLTNRPRTTSEFVARQLRARILSGDLPAGERLRQNHIAAELGVSSTPVREALRDLAAEGLVLSDAHRSNIVRGLTLADATDLYQIRGVLEPILIRRSFDQVAAGDLSGAEGLIAQMAATGDMALWAQLNRRFHACLWAGHEDTRLFRLIENLQDAAMPYVAMSIYGSAEELTRSDADHRAMLEAYRARDCAQAIALNERHLAATIAAIREKLSASED